MVLDEAVVEQLLRDLLGDLDLLPVLDVDLARHAGDPWAEPFGWPASPGPASPAERVDGAPGAGWPWCAPWVPDVRDSTDAPESTGAPEVPGAQEVPRARQRVQDGARTSQTADPGPEVATLAAALEALSAQVPSALPEAQALARTRWLLQATEQVKALSVEALADVETRQLHTLDDAPTVNAWTSSLAVPGVDSRDITLARRLRRVPQIRTETKAGRMSSRTAATLTTAVTKARPFLDRPDGLIDALDGEQALRGVLVDGICSLIAEQTGGAADAELRLSALRDELTHLDDPTRPQLARWEAALVVFARESDPALLASGVAMLVDALLPNEHDKRARQAEDQRGLDLHRNSVGSGWHVKGDLDDETGELLATVLDAAAATDPAGPDDTGKHADGRQALDDDTVGPDLWPADQPAPRSKRQQRHDALKRGLQALLDNGALGVRGKVAPHVAVTVGLEFVEGVPGSLPARTDHGARLSREQTRRLLCRSSFTRLVLDARRRVVEVSHTQRTSTALERLILKVSGVRSAAAPGVLADQPPAIG